MRQRPGLDFRNYGDVKTYRAELRSITRDLQQARVLLASVALRPSIGAPQLREAFRAFSGRLSYDPVRRRLDYCTGQYWPTEYRRAVCAVLASALWEFWRSDMPTTEELAKRKQSPGDYLRATARRELGATIQKRWFN